MSGPQFMHIETYAMSVSKLRKKREAARAEEGKIIDRKLTVEEICGEAARLEGHCPHVDAVAAPVLLEGLSPEQVPAILEERVLEANAAIKAVKAAMPRGSRKSGPRAIRADTHTLMTMVTSHPTPWIDPETGDGNFNNLESKAVLEKWEALNIAWAKLKANALGLDLLSVVRHEDEAHPHLHFLLIPRSQRMDARGSHPGYIAQQAIERGEGEDDKAFRRRNNTAYIQAMRAFQDDYYQSVGLEAGLLRTGPKRQRLSRAEYLQEKDAGQARALATVRGEQLKLEMGQAQEALAESKEMLAVADRDAVQAIVQAANIEAENFAAARELASKRAEAASFEDLSLNRQEVAIALEREEAALKAAEAKRIEAEAQASRVREDMHRQLVEAEQIRREVGLESDRLDREKKEFAIKKREGELVLEKQRMDVEAGKKELDALIEGVALYSEGLLRFDPSNRSKPFNLSKRANGEDQPMVDRVIAVKHLLYPIIASFDAAIKRRTASLTDAMSAAVAGWTNGILSGGEPEQNGPPALQFQESPEGTKLEEKISPFREVVAQVISVLPDLGLVAVVKRGLSRFGSHLNAAEQAEVQEFKRNLAMLERQRHNELE